MLCIADVIDPALLDETRAALADASFVDGNATAGWHARLVKNNEQLDTSRPEHAALAARLTAAIEAHPLYGAYAWPHSMRPLMISRYRPGMQYGTHVDDAMMGGRRCDLSFTLFLSDPDSYGGGELVIEGTASDQPVKLPAGSLVLYGSGSLHRVEPVTRGERLAAIGWVQSLVRDPARREILYDLDLTRRTWFQKHGKDEEFDRLSKVLSNLLRLWVEA